MMWLRNAIRDGGGQSAIKASTRRSGHARDVVELDIAQDDDDRAFVEQAPGP